MHRSSDARRADPVEGIGDGQGKGKGKEGGEGGRARAGEGGWGLSIARVRAAQRSAAALARVRTFRPLRDGPCRCERRTVNGRTARAEEDARAAHGCGGCGRSLARARAGVGRASRGVQLRAGCVDVDIHLRPLEPLRLSPGGDYRVHALHGSLKRGVVCSLPGCVPGGRRRRT